MRRKLMVFIALFVTASAWHLSAQTISLATLLDEMVDRDRIARLPEPAYTCRQASSYDRRAVSPQDIATWYANNDCSWFIRVEERDGRHEHVMMDEAGPGAIVRFWSTWSRYSGGTLRIYLDGANTPTIEGPLADIIDGGVLVGEPLSKGDSPLTEYEERGHNLYLPIPYANHCKVTYETRTTLEDSATSGEALFYQINFRTYPVDTSVETFSMDQLDTWRSKIASVQETLAAAGSGTEDLRAMSLDGTLAPGEAKQVEITAPAAIRDLVMKLQADDLSQALRSTVLEITFDGERTVWCPVGDFFGVGYIPAAYRSWYTAMDEDGTLSAQWIMPFQRSCIVKLHNLGRNAVTLSDSSLGVGAWDWDDRSMHFHTTWRLLPDVQTQTNQGAEYGAFDVNFVTVEGRGIYVGDTLTLFNGYPRWWGEGDEKVFVDGESFPSHFGTGSEDYYGYAWGNPNPFASPFHAQPYGFGADLIGMVVNSRYRLLDGIPFTRSLRFDMELFDKSKATLDYAPTTFWYARPGSTANVQPDAAAARLPVKQSPPMPIVEGAIEGEGLVVQTVTGGRARAQRGGRWNWSRYQQMWWSDAGVGDELTLLVDVPAAGRYAVEANLTRSFDYAIVSITFGDGTFGPIDLYAPKQIAEVAILGRCSLEAGPQPLRIRIVGSHESARPRHMFGLDYLKLTPLE
ncbi:MAG: DUF2961 domain-containing protein [Phycisphaeraceae bacterium]|nr:DUF2961 domain-containing protein [Phycisphaeraceae bacterium]